MKLEREIKLPFATPAEARAAVLATGAVPSVPRRLQHDRLLDTASGFLRDRRSVLRLRTEGDRHLLTFKGPVQASPMKLREERETDVASAEILLGILSGLGFLVWFRYEKFREEFTRHDVTITIDETAIGTFVEIEGSEAGITDTARLLGRSAADYILDSYRGLWTRHCEEQGVPVSDMLFSRG